MFDKIDMDTKVKASSNAGEAASAVSGVDVGQNGALGQTQNMLIRGVASEGTLILLDGIPLNSSLMGLYDLTKISGDAGRIEVVRGIQSSLYGANAVGGVVNIITHKGTGPLPLTAKPSLPSKPATKSRNWASGMLLNSLPRRVSGKDTDSTLVSVFSHPSSTWVRGAA